MTTPLLPVGTRVVGKPWYAFFDHDMPGTIAEVDPLNIGGLPYRVLFDGDRGPFWCRAEDLRAVKKEEV